MSKDPLKFFMFFALATAIDLILSQEGTIYGSLLMGFIIGTILTIHDNWRQRRNEEV